MDEVLREIKKHRGDIESCLLASQIQYDTNWDVRLIWIINPDGAVVKPRDDNSNELNAALGECLLERISQWRFPESAEGMSTGFVFNRFTQWE